MAGVTIPMRVHECPRCHRDSVPSKRMPGDLPLFCILGPIGNPCGQQLVPAPKVKRVVKPVLERDVLKAARAWLKYQKDIFVERVNVVRFGERREYVSARKGSADLHLVVGGKALFVELKRPGARQRPEQVAFQQKVEASGAVYIIEDSLGLETLKATVVLMRNRR